MASLIRPATHDDLAALMELFQQLDDLHSRELPQVFREATTSARSVADLQGLLADPAVALMVAELDHLIVGLVHVKEVMLPGSTYFLPARYAQVRDLVVHADHRHLGLGAALMAEAERWAASRGIGEIRLMVWEFAGSALPFYDSLGYSTLNRTMVKQLESK